MRARRSLWRLGGLDGRQLAVRVWDAADADEIIPRAAALSYAFLFSIFPLLLFVAALLSLVPVHHVIRQFMDSAAQLLPDEAATAVRNTLRQVITGSGHPGLISLAAITALWASSTGAATVMSMLNVVYRVRNTRPWWKRRAIAIVLTVVLALFVIVATLVIMLSARIGAVLGGAGHMLTTIAPIVLALVAVDLIYCVAPAQRRPWRWVTPGSVTFTVLWLAMSLGLRAYVAHFANYDVMYGSIGGLILFMLWLFLTSVVLLLGAEVNRVIDEAGAETSAASGDERPSAQSHTTPRARAAG
jgi:membrane protein